MPRKAPIARIRIGRGVLEIFDEKVLERILQDFFRREGAIEQATEPTATTIKQELQDITTNAGKPPSDSGNLPLSAGNGGRNLH